MFSDPDDFNIFRRDLYTGRILRNGYDKDGQHSHMAFGRGTHFCPGSWIAEQEVILGSQILPSGQMATVTFKNFDGSTCLFDIKVVGQQGQEGFIYKVDLCNVTNVNFS